METNNIITIQYLQDFFDSKAFFIHEVEHNIQLSIDIWNTGKFNHANRVKTLLDKISTSKFPLKFKTILNDDIIIENYTRYGFNYVISIENKKYYI